MNFKRALTASALAAGIGVAGLFGVGLAGANADPGCPPNAPCGQHDDHRGDNRGPGDNRGSGGPVNRDDNWHDNQGRDWQHRGIDDARFDHQPFDYNGQWVNPVWDGGHNAWGFWLGPIWIPL
jgi:hypothetical protein